MENSVDTVPRRTDIRIAYEQEALQSILESSEWNVLSPNYNRSDVLLPRELTMERIQKLVNACMGIIPRKPWDRVTDTDESLSDTQVSDLGSLTYIGGGERKRTMLLTTPNGKKMVISINGGYNLKLHIPKDPRIIFEQERPAIVEGSYYDARTYLSIPILKQDGQDIFPMGIHLQEYLGSEYLNDSSGLTMNFAAGRVKRYLRERNARTVGEGEFRHNRHYLLPYGRFRPPAVIDIPFDIRKPRGFSY